MVFVRFWDDFKAASDLAGSGRPQVLSFAVELLYPFPMEILYSFAAEFLYRFPVESSVLRRDF